MDEKDRLILFELTQDCRQPLHKIAKAVRLPKQTVDYRIKKLEDDKVDLFTYTLALYQQTFVAQEYQNKIKRPRNLKIMPNGLRESASKSYKDLKDLSYEMAKARGTLKEK